MARVLVVIDTNVLVPAIFGETPIRGFFYFFRDSSKSHIVSVN